MTKINKNGFTLVEILVVISIIGLLVAVSLFGVQGARVSARDSKRKADLEQIRSALELYKADCNDYPGASGSPPLVPSPLVGDNTPTTCSSTNTYISGVPTDPVSGNYYRYVPATTTYELWAYLENGSTPASYCSAAPSCGTSVTCNYCVENP